MCLNVSQKNVPDKNKTAIQRDVTFLLRKQQTQVHQRKPKTDKAVVEFVCQVVNQYLIKAYNNSHELQLSEPCPLPLSLSVYDIFSWRPLGTFGTRMILDSHSDKRVGAVNSLISVITKACSLTPCKGPDIPTRLLVVGQSGELGDLSLFGVCCAICHRQSRL